MTIPAPLADAALADRVAQILDENAAMTVATLRDDGWPQATVVGYVREGLTLYFGVARTSQKLRNIQRDARISIALGRVRDGRLRGLSLAAHAHEVTAVKEVERVNHILRDRYAHQRRLAPRHTSMALLRAEPCVISLIDVPEDGGDPQLAKVIGPEALAPLPSAEPEPTARAGRIAAPGARGPMIYVGSANDFYRPGAPL